MIFVFVDNGEETEIEVDDSLCSTSYVEIDLEEKDEDNTKEEETS